MTGTTPGPPPRDLPAPLFRARYPGFELRAIGTTYVATLKGAPWYAGPSLDALARQISATPAPDLRDQPWHLPAPGDAARLCRFLQDHPRWSVF
jgi:hypothetical protein